MSRNVVVGIVVVLVVAVLGWYFLRQQGGVSYGPAQTPQVTQPTESPPATSAAEEAEADKNVLTISSSGFSPQNVTIKASESVTWVNQDTVDHQVLSAVHPTHLLYPPLNTVGLLKPGEKKSLQFPKVGTYKYHDHLNPSLTGSVTVE